MTRKKQAVPHPYFKRGSAELERALKLATKGERMVWEKFGVAQFAPADPRLPKIVNPHTGLTDRSKQMAGHE